LRIVIIFILALSIQIIYAAESAKKEISFVEKVRPTLVQWLGDETTIKLIGNAPVVDKDDSIPMPAIPEIIENAKSIEVYNKKNDQITLGTELEQKYYVGFIKEIYEATRKQKANEDDIGKFYNVLSQGGTREGVYRALVLDNTYNSLENTEGLAVKSQAADFAIFFYQKYVNKKIAKDKFKGWSSYSLKRVLTEKALDIIDSYGENRPAIEAWYANLSSDLAFKFQQTMQNNLRKSTSSEVHLNWAKKVPVQHIKSEVIIKLHSSLNSLM
jgi:hypothetical protein